MNRVALIVDHDPLVLQIIADMLAALGCEVIMHQDATEALATFEKDQRIEILVADINMPRMAGHELAKRAKRLRPRVTPILTSGREMDGHGFPFLRKPFLQDDLARLMATTGLS